MAISRELFLGILSLDTYNRGYGQSITGLANPDAEGPQISIGNANIIGDALDDDGVAQSAGFYAIAYDMTGVSGFSAGEKVVAYRGSDSFLSGPGSSTGDVWAGYGVAIGLSSGPLAAQGELAIRFYQAVTGGDFDPRTRSSNITVTGHSLGAGLSGMVAKLYNLNGVHFDPMPFGAAVALALADGQSDYAYNLIHQSDPIDNLVYGVAALANGGGPWNSGFGSNTKSYAIPMAAGAAYTNWLDASRKEIYVPSNGV